ncbi:MAG TPA: sulfite exporter TauE/SafE family protein [Isosphaeraceae bacterium]|nr:sulfite exporter TauE/SafE family protein [Isosphaeraceae bacterium]
MIGWQAVASALVLGLVAGVLSGMFGIGGGLVIVPTLVIVYHEEIKTATGTSLFALMWPVGLLGVIEYWRRGELRPVAGLWIAVGLFFGAYFGAKITGAISPATMRRIYGIFLLVVGTYFLAFSKPKPTTPPISPQVEAPPGPAGAAQVH